MGPLSQHLAPINRELKKKLFGPKQMNPQLRQFEKESKLEIFGLGARREIWDRALEKFAELIVKEMLQTCEDHPAWTGRMIGEQIKQQFGVEE